MGAGHALWQDLLVAVVTAFVMELAFRRCLFFEWSRYGILPAIIGSGLITMLLTPLPQWPGALLLGLCAAAVYQVTGCLVMTSVFHMGFLVAQTLLLHGPNPQQVLSAAVMVLLLAAALVGCWAALTLSPNGKETIQKMVVQQKNPIRHPYVFRTSFNFLQWCWCCLPPPSCGIRCCWEIKRHRAFDKIPNCPPAEESKVVGKAGKYKKCRHQGKNAF